MFGLLLLVFAQEFVAQNRHHPDFLSVRPHYTKVSLFGQQL